MPNIYNNTIEFIKTEASSPYYLDNTNSFDSNITIDLNADDTLNGKNILEVLSSQKSKNASITIKNIGDNSFIRVVGEGAWIYDIPNIKSQAIPLIGELKRTDYDSISTGIDYFNTTLNTDSQITEDISYSGLFSDTTNMLNPHVLNIKVYNGPHLVKSEQAFYYPVSHLMKSIIALAPENEKILEK